MIGKIKGTLTEIEGNTGLIETSSGLSYQVYLTGNLLATLIPSPIDIYTYLQVREDAHVLFGFKTKDEYKIFQLLLTVSGVGPKTAFSIVSGLKIEDLLNSIKNNDVEGLTRVPGLGRKTAMKIILELSQKLKQEFNMEKMYVSEEDKLVVDALVSLGYKSQDAKQLLKKIPANLSVEDKIKEGLRLGSNKK